MTSEASAQSTPTQRWLARLSFLLALLALVILVLFAELKSLAMVAVALAAAVASVAAAYFFGRQPPRARSDHQVNQSSA
jgi:hypothetical protein